MTDALQPEYERLLDLEIQQATTGLSGEEMREYEQLYRSKHGSSPAEQESSMEFVAAAADLSMGPQSFDPLPKMLRDRLLINAGQNWSMSSWPADSDTALVIPPRQMELAKKKQPLMTASQVLAYVIAASCLVAAYWFGPWNQPSQPTLAERYASFVKNVGDGVEKMSMAAGPDETGKNAHGELFWSESEQKGFMKLSKFETNEPSLWQYQLWIFQEKVDKQDVPVDGGVFDIVKGNDDIIEFRARTKASRGFIFVVTVEKAGGVPRSDRERIAAYALSSKADGLVFVDREIELILTRFE